MVGATVQTEYTRVMLTDLLQLLRKLESLPSIRL
jgi:hypothetical protein